ncbi:MAG: SLBB domain-containing protein [Acidobacteriota bacterium]|nr:SLBB domain-containing protein [Acidobacteriota bacterium]
MWKSSLGLLVFLTCSPAFFAQTAPGTEDKNNSPEQQCGLNGCVPRDDAGIAREQTGTAALTRITGRDDVRSAGQRPEQRSQLPKELPPQQPSDFENYVQDATDRAVPVFGRNLFQDTPADFEADNLASPPADYVLGPGDQLRIRGYGSVDVDVKVTVDRNGQIFIPQVGSLVVAGMQMDQVETALANAVNAQFKSMRLSVTLAQLRTIQVFVLGHARRPGVYAISSLSTLVNALFVSGGPSASGSLRNIQVKRDGKILTHFDVYALLLNGDKSGDVHLRSGDIIFIPLVGPQIAVEGDVTTPGIFELNGPTTADQALQMAGGLTPIASTARASLDRVVDHERRTVEDFPLNGPQRLIAVQAGDVLLVFPISSKIGEAVTLRGNVGQPGRYAWHKGMRLSDLIPTRQFLVTRNYYNRQNALNPPYAPRAFAVAEQNEGTSTGAAAAISASQAAAASTSPDAVVAAQITHQQTTNLSTDADGRRREQERRSADPPTFQTQPDIASHETEINWNYASIERLGSSDLTTHIIPVALGEAIDHPDSADDKLLQPGDVVVIYSKRDLNLPTELRASFVRIDGEVTAPGIYRLENDDTLRDLIQRAGGLGPHAYPYGSVLTRESVRLSQELELRKLIAQESRAALSPINNPAFSATPGDNVGGQLALRRAYIDELSKVHASGRVVLQVSPVAHALTDLPAFRLQDGDHVFIPAIPNTVAVVGSVPSPGSLRYVPNTGVQKYLNSAGGPLREGDKKQEFVLRADGTVLRRERASRFDHLLLYPGDSVVVPARMKPGFNTYELLNFTQTLSAFALSAAAINAIK